MKRTAAKPIYDAAGGRVLPDGSQVDFVLFMPGDHFEIVDDDEFEEASHDEALADEDTSVVHLLHPVRWIELDHAPDERAIAPRQQPLEREAARAQRIAYERRAHYESHGAHGILLDDDDLEELETVPEPALDAEVTHAGRPRERTWWEAARRGLRIRPER